MSTPQTSQIGECFMAFSRDAILNFYLDPKPSNPSSNVIGIGVSQLIDEFMDELTAMLTNSPRRRIAGSATVLQAS